MPSIRRDYTLAFYISKVRMEVTKQGKNLWAHKSRDKLMSKEWLAIHGLRLRENIIINPADKGSTVVAQSRQDNIKEAGHQLSNTTCWGSMQIWTIIRTSTNSQTRNSCVLTTIFVICIFFLHFCQGFITANSIRRLQLSWLYKITYMCVYIILSWSSLLFILWWTN